MTRIEPLTRDALEAEVARLELRVRQLESELVARARPA